MHPTTERKLTAIQADLPQGLLLAGKPGVGLATIAKHLAGAELAAFIVPLDSKEEINHETGTISVASIRDLYDQTRAKHVKRQVFVIDDADHMSPGAGAAFLKLLEEPTPNTHFILTSHSPQALLPTVRSRVQTLTVEPVTSEQTKALLGTFGSIDTKTRAQLEYLGAGLPAEVLRLLNDDTYFKQRAEIMADTRVFLTGSTYQKLLVIHKYYPNKSNALQLLNSALAVSRHSLNTKPQANLINQLDKLLAAKEKIEANCNVRLQLMALVV